MPEKAACLVTHREILEGVCPWCNANIKHGQVIGTSHEPAKTEWNWDTFEAALRDGDCEVRSQTADNLSLLTEPLDKLLALQAIALADNDPQIRYMAEHACRRLGDELDVEQLLWLEQQTQTDGLEFAARLVLLQAYFLNREPAVRARRADHILWIIEHHPECSTAGSPAAMLLQHDEPAFYEAAKQLWLTQCLANQSGAAVPGNAAQFFLLSEPKLAQKLLLNAQTIEPDNPQWHTLLAQLHKLSAMHGSEEHRREQSRRALVELEMAEQLRSSHAGGHSPRGQVLSPEESQQSQLLNRMYTLPDRAKAAFDAGELQFARQFAAECLALTTGAMIPEYFRQDGNAIHYSHLILGRIALREGDIQRAKAHLIESGKTKGSCNLNSFGPNMSLAAELLERGESDVVLEYLNLCGKFWERGAVELAQWRDQIRRRKLPSFGANLSY